MTKKKDPKDIKKSGRPVKWDEDACTKLALLLETYFEEERLKFLEATKDNPYNTIPFISKFCRDAGLSQETLNVKAGEYPVLSDALKKAKEIQKEILISGGLSGRFNPTAFIFTAKNITDMRDQTPTLPDGSSMIAGFIVVKDSDGKKDNSGSTSNNQAK